jgi:hypothetical protein
MHSPTVMIAIATTSLPFAAASPWPVLPRDTTVPTNDSSALVSLSDFPSCANASCVTSSLLMLTRLGCPAEGLTTDCLCSVAVTPLACAPLGPSDQDNCWFELEAWFASVCPSVKMIDPGDMQACMSNCTIDAIVQKGCPADGKTGSVTSNCFCKLEDTAVENAAALCKTDQCPKHFQPAFDIQDWRENICQQGFTSHYNEHAYHRYFQRVKAGRIVAILFLPLVALLITIPTCLLMHLDMGDEPGQCVAIFCLVLSGLYLIVLPPLYTAI